MEHVPEQPETTTTPPSEAIAPVIGAVVAAGEIRKITYIPSEDPAAVRERDGIKPQPIGTRYMRPAGNGKIAPKNAGDGHDVYRHNRHS